MVKLNMMKEKFTYTEIIYYIISAYCLWSSQHLFLVTVKMQGTEHISYFDTALIFLGALAPITVMTSAPTLSGTVVGVFILLSPLLGIVLFHDFKRARFGGACFAFTIAVTSQVVTGTYFNIMAGLGGLFALVVIGIMFLIALASTIRDEIRKQFKS